VTTLAAVSRESCHSHIYEGIFLNVNDAHF